MYFYIVTLFPDIFNLWLSQSMLGRARQQKRFEFETLDLRSYTDDGRVDDKTFGGPSGMVFKLEPLVRCLESLQAKSGKNPYCIYFSPSGKALNLHLVESIQEKAIDRPLVLVCGHYEGVDQRFLDHYVDLEISIGDFVLTGGELPALVLTELMVRYSGLLSEEHLKAESFSLKSKTGHSLLEYPHYTKPQNFRGLTVPEVLLSGNHREINLWRQKKAIEKTMQARPNLQGLATDKPM